MNVDVGAHTVLLKVHHAFAFDKYGIVRDAVLVTVDGKPFAAFDADTQNEIPYVDCYAVADEEVA